MLIQCHFTTHIDGAEAGTKLILHTVDAATYGTT